MPTLKLKLKKPFTSIKAYVPKGEEFWEEDESLKEKKIERIPVEEQISSFEQIRKIPEKPIFIQEYKISDSNQPVPIDLHNIPDETTVPIEQVKLEIQSAYNNGFEDGQKVTRTTFEMEIQKQQEWLRRFDSVIEEFKSHYFEQIKNLEASIVPLAKMIAEAILQRELKTNPSTIIEQVKKALGIVTNDIIFKIYLHPSNVEILEEVKSSLIKENSSISQAKIIADDNIDEFGCILETSVGIIDTTLKAQLDMLANHLQNAPQLEYDMDIGYDTSRPD